MGDLAVATGDLAVAKEHYETRLDIAQRLFALDPSNAQWAQDLEGARQRLADLGQS